MKVTGVKTYVIENESAPRTGGGSETGNWYIGGKYFLILEHIRQIRETTKRMIYVKRCKINYKILQHRTKKHSLLKTLSLKKSSLP